MSDARENYARQLFGPRELILEEIMRHALLIKRMPTIQLDDDAARLLQLLTLIHRPKRVLEIGLLFGFSTVHIARGLPPGGKVIGVEIDPAAAELARHSLEVAGLSDRAEIVCADALAYLAGIGDEPLDMVFIDAEKSAYPEYLKAVAPKLRRGGLIVADDAFAEGVFASSDEVNDAELRGIHAYNRALARAPAFFSSLIPTRAGLMVSVKL